MGTRIQRVIHKTVKVCFFVTAVVTGMLFAIVWRSYENTIVDVPYQVYVGYNRERHEIRRIELPYQDWLKKQGLQSKPFPEEDLSYGNKVIETEAQFLAKKVKVLCLILSKGKNKASSVKETWGRHCNHILFYGSYVDAKIPVHRLSSLEPSHVSFCKILLQIFKDDVNETASQHDWLLIAQDSSYVIVENVRKLVAPLDSKDKLYLGRPVKQHSKPAFNALDSVILLSKGSIDFILDNFFLNSSSCQKSHFFEEGVNRTVEVSRSFEVSLSIMLNPRLFYQENETSSFNHSSLSVSDTRDDRNRSRFLPFNPQMHVIPDSISVFSPFYRHNILESGEGLDCCSDSAISFGLLSPSRMYLLEYFLYHLNVFKNSDKGLGNRPAEDSHDTSNDELWNNVDVGQGSVLEETGDSRRNKKPITRKKSLWFNF